MKKRHTQSFKLKVVEKALNRTNNDTLESVAKQYGIGYSTLTRWMYEVKQGKLTEERSAAMPKHKRPVDWSVEEKLQAIMDTERLDERDKGRYCREKGIYQHQIEHWKQQLMSKTDNNEQTQQYKTQIKALKEENKRLQKELARKEKALAEAAALMILKKKAQALFGSDEED